MTRVNYSLPDNFIETVRRVAEREGISYSEALRRAAEKGFRQDLIGESFPALSGQQVMKRA